MKRYLPLTLLISFFSAQPALAMKRGNSDVQPSGVERTVLIARAATLGIELMRNMLLTTHGPAPEYTNTALQNRGVFLVTNEIGNEGTLEEIRNVAARGNVGIGVSALFNLELFVARLAQGVTHWVMIDPAPEVQTFWRELQAIFARTNNLDAVFERLHDLMSFNRHLFFTDGFLRANSIDRDDAFTNWLRYNLDLAQARLQEQMRRMEFETLRKLVLEGLFFVQTDLADPQSVTRLIEFLSQHAFLLDTIYTSNVDMHLPRQDVETFREQIMRLRLFTMNSGTAYLVEARPRGDSLFARTTGKSYQRINFE